MGAAAALIFGLITQNPLVVLGIIVFVVLAYRLYVYYQSTKSSDK